MMPLLAVAEILQKDYECVWIGSFGGIEKKIIQQKKIKYIAIPSGKLRKYFSFANIFEPFFVLAGFLGSFFCLLAYNPRAVIVSGSFISVPLIWASWVLGIRRIVHQEDINIGLAGKLSIPLASAVTCSFPETAEKIRNKTKLFIGNPVRSAFRKPNIKKWKTNLPLILVLGGGLGSEKINKMITDIAAAVCKRAQIIHLTGRNKNFSSLNLEKNYKQIDFLGDELADVMAASDVIVSRAGLSTISEAAYLGKPMILIPLKGVGQDKNANYLLDRGAAVVVGENYFDLQKEILNLISDKHKMDKLSENIRKIFPPGAAEALAELVK